ncbi:SGNH/GDSL hydrolase family protein [Ulvibacterium sp.]|uniref:SGNH/GDSL hydrolase family protein n=1 Tax=Ulvibacterium sp. TaxID=2665914 RepID=UPI0026103623|nr:SGNH/GDSL hydrolase family protein [Ulvibacterium sp.]
MLGRLLKGNLLLIAFVAVLGPACSTDAMMDSESMEPERNRQSSASIGYLALGDSYTAGTGIDPQKSFPKQLQQALAQELNNGVTLQVVARAGWRTDNLIDALAEETPADSYDLVTLLIGVNNQFQNRPFAQYEDEFPKLLDKALNLVGNDPERVTVISIPDYFFTPFGQDLGFENISEEIDNYNNFASAIAEQNGIPFVDITDISRNGLEDTSLVAGDNLHLSEKAYQMFLDRIVPGVVSKLKD